MTTPPRKRKKKAKPMTVWVVITDGHPTGVRLTKTEAVSLRRYECKYKCRSTWPTSKEWSGVVQYRMVRS